jgi:hypothetical protein
MVAGSAGAKNDGRYVAGKGDLSGTFPRGVWRWSDAPRANSDTEAAKAKQAAQ